MTHDEPARSEELSASSAPSSWNRQSEDGRVLLSLPWEVFVLGLSLMSIINIGLMLLASDPDIRQVVAIMDTGLILVFAVDFLRRLQVATDNRRYLISGVGWLDLISITPMLRIARVLRIVRTIRVMQRMGGGRAFRVFFENRATGGLLSVFLLAILVFEYGAMAILWAEGQAEAPLIVTGSDALWYLIVTMSTVGYGDLYPTTDLGRLIGSLIIVVGVGVFGTLTGFLANAFLAPRRESGS